MKLSFSKSFKKIHWFKRSIQTRSVCVNNVMIFWKIPHIIWWFYYFSPNWSRFAARRLVGILEDSLKGIRKPKNVNYEKLSKSYSKSFESNNSSPVWGIMQSVNCVAYKCLMNFYICYTICGVKLGTIRFLLRNVVFTSWNLKQHLSKIILDADLNLIIGSFMTTVNCKSCSIWTKRRPDFHITVRTCHGMFTSILPMTPKPSMQILALRICQTTALME